MSALPRGALLEGHFRSQKLVRNCDLSFWYKSILSRSLHVGEANICMTVKSCGLVYLTWTTLSFHVGIRWGSEET